MMIDNLGIALILKVISYQGETELWYRNNQMIKVSITNSGISQHRVLSNVITEKSIAPCMGWSIPDNIYISFV